MSDPKAIVRRGYDLGSRAYRAGDAADGEYPEWLDLLAEGGVAQALKRLLLNERRQR